MRLLSVLAALLLAGCDLVPGPAFSPTDLVPPSSPRPAPDTMTLEGLGSPFADVYPAGEVEGKSGIHDLAVVDGRVYLGHGSTNSAVPTRPVYYDVAAGAWGVDDAVIHQEGTFSLDVGPSGRLYASADDAIGVPKVLMIRRELDGSWTERVADDRENHSRHTYEWADPETGETLVFIQNAAPHFPDVSVSYDGGETFTAYGYEASGVEPLRQYTFFGFRGELYAASFRPQAFAGYPTPKARPYLVRYTRDRERPFEVVAQTRAEVFPGEGSQVDEVAVLGNRLVVASYDFLSGTALSRDRMDVLPVSGQAVDLVRVGDAVYLLSADGPRGPSTLYVTRDGVTVDRVETFDRRFTAVEHAAGAFYLAEGGRGDALWRYRPAP